MYLYISVGLIHVFASQLAPGLWVTPLADPRRQRSWSCVWHTSLGFLGSVVGNCATDVKKEQPFSEGTSIEVILFLSQSIRVQCIWICLKMGYIPNEIAI